MRNIFSYGGVIGLASLTGVVFAFGFSTAANQLADNLISPKIFVYQGPVVITQVATPVVVLPTPKSETTLTFVGDIMLDRGVATSVKNKGGGDYSWLFTNLPPLNKADILLSNLEGPVSDQGVDRHNLYSFRMNPEGLLALRQTGFDVLQIANNHIGDWGLPAFSDTLSRLASAGLAAIGGGNTKAEASATTIIEKHGVKIGFVAATDVGPEWLAATATKPGIILASDPEWPVMIEAAAKQVDILVVGYHFGDEYQKDPSPRQQTLAHLAIDRGAKLVIGTHPHVVEPVEEYHGGLIAYSLGNFIFDQAFSGDTMSGLVLTVTLQDKDIIGVKEQKVLLDQNFKPTLVDVE